MRDNALSVIVCGSSAAMVLPDYLTKLRQQTDHPLRLLLTSSAQRFVKPEALSWVADETYTSTDSTLNPTELARRSKGIVVLPATANMLACAALGIAATAAQTALLASPRPVMFLPSMNQVMWDKRTTRDHVTSLRAEGHVVVDPIARETFEIWSRQAVTGLGMPLADDVAKYVSAFLDEAGER